MPPTEGGLFSVFFIRVDFLKNFDLPYCIDILVSDILRNLKKTLQSSKREYEYRRYFPQLASHRYLSNITVFVAEFFVW